MKCWSSGVRLLVCAGLLVVAIASACAEKVTLRVGYFPNITHAQGIVGSHTTREGRGWFEQRLGPDVTVQWSSSC
jgi:NitT/TauT family transport system substrate-binding protein